MKPYPQRNIPVALAVGVYQGNGIIAMDNEFNFELCQERHERIGRRLEKLENRFLTLISGIALTLITVVVNLIILIKFLPG